MFVVAFFLLQNCDYVMCSDNTLSLQDQTILYTLNNQYANFEIYSDDCLPLGYYNVRIKSRFKTDTLMLYKILDQTLEKKVVPNQIQVFSSESDLKFILYKIKDKHMILLPDHI